MRSRPALACVATLLLVLAAAPGARASVLGLAPTAPPIWHPAQDLPRDEVFARLDALGDRLHEQGFETTQELLELAVLHACTDRAEDRAYAIEILERACEREPERLDLVLWELRLRHQTGSTTAAVRRLDSVARRFQGAAAFHYAQGYAHWIEARRNLDRDGLRAARLAFARACELDPGSWPSIAALAAVCLIQDEPEAIASVLPPITRGESLPLSRLLLTAAVLSYETATQDRAENLLAQAIRALPEGLSGAFLHGEGRLPGVEEGDLDAAAAYWNGIDPDPLRSSNGLRLEFWRRLLQADAIWGNVASGTPGWSSPPGDAWVRWGRPSAATEITPDIVPFVSVNDGGSGASEAQGAGMRANMRSWIWSYAEGIDSFDLTFVDRNYLRDWHVAPEDDAHVTALQRDRPLRFVAPAVRSSFELAVDVAMLLPSDDRSSLLTSVAVFASGPGTSGEIENLGDVDLSWALFDRNERRIDEGAFVLDPDRNREGLLAPLDAARRATGARPARVGRFGLDVKPGRYRLAVEAIDQISGARRWTDARIEIPRRPDDRLELSDLVLCASFDDYDPETAVPLEFVRYASVLVPAPERRLPGTQDKVFVYFEAYDLGIAPDGSTRFSVEYRVVPVGTPEAAPTISQFTRERTGLSPEGAVIKGTGIDLDGIAPGAYVLIVTVEDQIRGARSERSLEFVVDEIADDGPPVSVEGLGDTASDVGGRVR